MKLCLKTVAVFAVIVISFATSIGCAAQLNAQDAARVAKLEQGQEQLVRTEVFIDSSVIPRMTEDAEEMRKLEAQVDELRKHLELLERRAPSSVDALDGRK